MVLTFFSLLSFYTICSADIHLSLLQNEKLKGQQITLKIKKRREGAGEAAKFLGHGIVDNYSKSVTLPDLTSDSNIISKHVKNLFVQLCVCYNYKELNKNR